MEKPWGRGWSPPPSHSNHGCKNGPFWVLRGFILDFFGGEWGFVACGQQTLFRSSLLSLLAEAREATTGNASGVRRLGGLLFRFSFSKIGSRVPVSQRLISPPPPKKTPKVHPPGMFVLPFCFSDFISFVIAFP